MATMPPGFKFKPSNDELVNHYLNRKIYGCLQAESNEQVGLAIPDHFVIPDMYIYDYDPWELHAFFKERSLAQPDNGECYFFCPRRNKYRKGHEENRATKSGFWKSRGKKQTIRTSIITAEKIGLTFYRGQQRNGIVTEYKMHQYRPISINLCNITPEEMPYDLCYIFMKKTKQDQGDNTPLCNNEGESSTAIISTANNMKISPSQSDHQRDEIIELEETYGSQLPMYYGTNEIYSIQHNSDVYKETTVPSTAYAYASFNSEIPGDHQVDRPMELEEIYSELPQLDDNFNVIYLPST